MSQTVEPTVKGSLTLKISNISTYMTKVGQRIRSPPQQLAGLGWCIEASPKVIDNVSYLSCYLMSVNAYKWSASVDATFRIVKKNGGFGNETILHKKVMGKKPLAESWGWEKFISSEELLSPANGFVVNDSIEIRADLILKDVLFSLFEKDEAANIKLKYLSVVSSVFRDMFAVTEVTESNEEMGEIELKDLDSSEFKEFLGVIYPSRHPITDNNVISVFRIADRFDVQHVVTGCETHLAGVNSVPWFEKLKLAVDLHRDDLLNHLIATMTCTDVSVADCFDAVAMTRPFCSAVDDDELLRRKKATTSADGMFLFSPRDAKEP
ncbi:BATH-38 protein [Aphelenchoides avenae]|nr:BATH-38 protein [Aphelenchus avenae]